MTLPENILQFKNHNFGDKVDFVDDPSPRRLMFHDGKFENPKNLDEWITAPFEVRMVIGSRTPEVPQNCVILFRRVEEDPWKECR